MVNGEAKLNETSWLNTRTITSAGGIIIALALVYLVYSLLDENFDRISNQIERQIDVQMETNKALNLNSQVIQSLNQYIRDKDLINR